MKKLVLMLVLGASMLATIASADVVPFVSPHWKSVDLKVRRSGNALTNQTYNEVVQGYIDSTFIYNGATGRADTLAPVVLTDWVTGVGASVGAASDSLGYVFKLEVIGSQAFASGESLYVTTDGLDGSAFDALGIATCGTCMAGGYGAAAALVPGTATSEGKWYNSKGSATATSVADPFANPWPGTLIMQNTKGYTTLRFRIRSDSATAPVAQLIRFRLWYLSSSSQ